jgi:adenine-specific DNA-methyltransferase
MKLSLITPKTARKPFLKQKPLRKDIDVFRKNLKLLFSKINEIEREENQKNCVRDFLRDTFYKDTNEINTKDSKDLVIHLGKTNKDKVGVIIEAKRPSNKLEMVSAQKPNCKALQELILYYLRERIEENNLDCKHCIVTNIYEWYIIDASYFENLFARNKSFIKQYEQWRDNKKVTSDTKLFYESIAKPFIDSIEDEISCVYFDIRDYETIVNNENNENNNELIALYKIFSPQFLLKTVTPNDSNSLNEKFYRELLHILGLEEVKESNKNIIRRKIIDRNNASFIEMAINKLQLKGIHKVKDLNSFGETLQEQYFNIALELCITWINRILFLKLLEGQLINYHKPLHSHLKGDDAFSFLNIKTIPNFDELFTLFHSVLAINVGKRVPSIQLKYKQVPYLNSSLFEISQLEDVTISIDNLDNNETLPYNSNSVLKEGSGKKTGAKTLEYLFAFLDSYDFASEGNEEIQEEKKDLINASVLGKIFEKINGYKDGSIYTPAFITMYMCRQSIRKAVVEKFNVALSQKNETLFDKFEDVKNYTTRLFKTQEILKANAIINSMHICDPAVGSGHFLVSALNEIICIKAELGILADQNGNSISGYAIDIINDEIVISDPKGNSLEYKIINQKPASNNIQHLQKTLFLEKQLIIENCLFGVDINPNSVKICRLRLWIELLKNAYYKEESNFTELETLPNIDINIKCGNSLISRFKLTDNLSKALKSIKYDIKAYRGFVQDYKHEKNRDAKRILQTIIDTIKADFRTEIIKTGKDFQNWYKAKGEFEKLTLQFSFFELTPKEKKQFNEDIKVASQKMQKFEGVLEEIKANVSYRNAFEWRFEFPEVLNDNGDFEGFDVVIANPPYFSLAGKKNVQEYFLENYKTFLNGVDIYCLFLELSKNISSKNGQNILITSNKWRTASYGVKTRNFLTKDVSNLTIVDFNKFQVFSGVSVDAGIISFTNNLIVTENLQFKVKNKSQDVQEFLMPSQQYETLQLVNVENWNLEGFKFNYIKQKLEKNNLTILDLGVNLNRGITTGFNNAFVINENVKAIILKQTPDAKLLIKPLLRGRDIKKYAIDESKLWVICIPKGFTIKNNIDTTNNFNVLMEPTPRYGTIPIDEAEEWFKNNYFGIWSHLKQFKNQLQNRIDKGDFWWELRACSYLYNFEKNKIIFTKASKIQAFTFDSSRNYLLNTSYFFTGDNLKYLLAILNSKLIKFSFLNFYQGGGIEGEITLQAIEKIPIAFQNKVFENKITTLVDKIILSKQQNKETLALENQIDALVYKLYNLSEDEIKVVENG